MIRNLKIYHLVILVAMFNGKSCEAQTMEFSEIVKLNSAVKENSGIVVIKGIVYTHNDSGDGPYIYQFPLAYPDQITKTKLDKADNTDWEDMAYDDGHIFVFDTGNNKSNRKKMTYYKIPVQSLVAGEIPEMNITEVDFKFINEYGKAKKVNCEAATIDDGELLFVSKSNSRKAEIYTAIQGEAEAHYQSQIKLPVEVTGVATHEGKIYFCGYEKIGDNIYLSRIGYLIKSPEVGWKKPSFVMYEGKIKGQCEGIFIEENILYISSEQNLLAGPKLYLMDINKLKS
jgi:hypothetical protein